LLKRLDETLADLTPWQRRTFGELAGWVADEVEEKSDTQRDEFLRSLAALAALAPVDAAERLAYHGDRAVDAGLVTAHEEVADSLALLHRTSRADVMAGLVASHADTLFRLLDRPMPPTVRRRLEAITVGQCAHAGHQAFRLNDRAAARRHFALARDVADDSRDGTLLAQALGTGSIVHSTMPTGGRSGNTARAVGLLRAAVHHDRGPAWLHWWLACELAADGDERGFRSAATTAERVSARRGHTDGRGFFAHRFQATDGLASQNTGIGLVRLGHAHEAIEALEASLIAASALGTVISLVDLAAARVLQGEPERACSELSRALDLALDAGYAMGVERITGVRAQFPTGWTGLARVTELDERLRPFVHQSSPITGVDARRGSRWQRP
jgi:hypothetical protein